MGFGYEQSGLWRSSLGADAENDLYAAPRNRLRAAYHAFRQRAALLAAEIPQDLREYTVHDATHLDALWELADQIAGEKVTLTPTEGFVLGGAFLIHDLGMGLGAYPGGIDQLMTLSSWRDILASCVSSVIGRPATEDDLAHPPESAFLAAKEIALRENHASRASDLALISWNAIGTNDQYHLIDDSDLRENYGRLIGRIAASHWWDLDLVADEFSSVAIGAPVDCPDEWTVDALKLACLMRLADAAHLDARRAPGFLRTVRRPSGQSDLHWIFQGHMQRPRVDGDRLVYTAARPFEQSEAAAWWLGYEAIQMVDQELHGVDALRFDRNLVRFAAKSVKGAEAPQRLNALIPTLGWVPIDARVTVSNVPALVRKLGGESLYGNAPWVALRELLQNACDATLALEKLVNAPSGPIKVSLDQSDGRWFLEVSDCGVGMSQRAVVGPFLDFGRSYWGSELMREESPGLASSRFSATGRFGIGFYSIFMLGDDVKVITRRYDEASNDTRVLEFCEGVSARPILRQARGDEIKHLGGTRIRVALGKDPYEREGLLYRGNDDPPYSLKYLCNRHAPALPYDLMVTEPDGAQAECLKGNDWKTMDSRDLLVRLSRGQGVPTGERAEMPLALVAERMRTIEYNGDIVARAALVPSSGLTVDETGGLIACNGVVVAGGLRVEDISSVAGIFSGVPLKADREKAKLAFPDHLVRRWASEQAGLWADYFNSNANSWSDWTFAIAILAELRADFGKINIAACSEGYLDQSSFLEWAKCRERIVAVHEYSLELIETGPNVIVRDEATQKEVILDDDVLLVVNAGHYGGYEVLRPSSDLSLLQSKFDGTKIQEWYGLMYGSFSTVMLEKLSLAWSLDFGSLLSQSDLKRYEPSGFVIGKLRDGTVYRSRFVEWIAHRQLPGNLT